MGAIDRFLRRNRGQDNIKPLMKRLEANMLAAVKQAGGSAWYVPDDFVVLGPELVVNGNFESGLNGWTNVGATASVVSDQGGNVLSLSAAGGATNLNQPISLDAGKSYRVSFRRRGIVAGSGLNGRLSFLYSDSTSAVSPSSSVTVRSDYELVSDVIVPAKPVTTARLLATTSSGDSVGVVYFDDISIREILSAKDFQDNSVSLPSYLSGQVGLQYDMAGTIGTELIQTADTSADWQAQGTTPPTAVNGSDIFLGKPCRSVTFPTIASGGYTVCRAVDVGNSFSITANQSYYAEFEYALSRDLTAGESVAIALTGVAGIYTKAISAGALGNVWCKGSGGQIAAVTGVDSLRPYATTLNAPLTVYIRRVSCKLVSGNQVVQATAANRPTITRIPRKLGPELIVNGNFDADASGWTSGVATLTQTAGELQVTSIGAVYGYARQSVTVEVGKTYQVKGKGRLGTANLAWILAGTGADALAYTSTSLAINSTTQSIKSMTFAAKESNLVITLENNNAVSNATSFFDEISVREVLEWSYALTFDGSNDSLAAPASVIGANLSQPYTIIQAFRAGQVGTGQRIQGDTGRWVSIGSTNKLVVTHQGSTFVVGVSDTTLGELLISEVTWDGTTAKIWKNGVLDGQGAIAAPSGVTPSAHNIGQNGGNASYFKGDFVYSCVCPAVMTDAQRAAVRKFAAAQMGMSL